MLFDALGWPWPIHSCWVEHSNDRSKAVQQMEDVLHSKGYEGQGELINIRPSQVPETIPSKGRRNPPELRIKLVARDPRTVDNTAEMVVEFITERHHRQPIAFPLPVRPEEKSDEEATGSATSKHRRAIDVWAVTAELIEQLTQLGLPETVKISIQQAESR